MKKFELYYEQFVNRETIAILPGGFKPPTKGHFQAMSILLENANRGVVFIGKSERDGVTQDMSYQIWSKYLVLFNKPVEIIKSPITPVKSTYDFAEEYNNRNIIVGVGAKDDDKSRYNSFLKNPEKYHNVKVESVDIQGGGISGTEVRDKIAMKDPDVVKYFVPDGLNQTTIEEIQRILGIA